MQYSPTLKQAMEEIKAIVKKYDIAAQIALHKADIGSSHIAGFTEYLNFLTPSYSCIEFSKDGNHVTFKLDSKKHYEGDKLLRDIKAAATANMLMHFVTNAGSNFMFYNKLKNRLDEAGKAEHDKEGGHTSHNQQNN
jgi:hypothetical protein